MEEKKSKQIIKYIFIVLLVSVFAYLIVGEYLQKIFRLFF